MTPLQFQRCLASWWLIAWTSAGSFSLGLFAATALWFAASQ